MVITAVILKLETLVIVILITVILIVITLEIIVQETVIQEVVMLVAAVQKMAVLIKDKYLLLLRMLVLSRMFQIPIMEIKEQERN